MLRQIQLLVGAMMSSLVVLAIVLVAALTDDDRFAAPPMWLLAAQFGAGAAIFLLLEAIGYRTIAIHPEADQAAAMSDAFGAFQSGTIMRFSLSELVALGSIVAAFAMDSGGVTGFATGALVSLALMGYHAWPWSRPIDKTIASLERDGGRSHLRDRLGLPPKLGGAIQEL